MIFVSSWWKLGVTAAIVVAAAADIAFPAELTFNKDIAPLLWTRCGACHRPGASAPFSLIDYQDVVPRARQIVTATKNRVMPPWLPEAGHGEFANSRRLEQDEIDRLEQWVKDGAREGRPEDLSARPQWNDGWQLGTPDLVVTLPVPYQIPASPSDAFRSFVIPIPLTTSQYVEGCRDQARKREARAPCVDRHRSHPWIEPARCGRSGAGVSGEA